MKPARGSARKSTQGPGAKGKARARKENIPTASESPGPSTAGAKQQKQQTAKKRKPASSSPQGVRVRGQERWKPPPQPLLSALDRMLNLSLLSVLSMKLRDKEETQKHLNILKERFLYSCGTLPVPPGKNPKLASWKHQTETQKTEEGKKKLTTLEENQRMVVSSLEELEVTKERLDEENRIMRSRVEEEEENRIMRSRVEEEEENRIMRSRVEEEENRIMRSRVEEEEENRIMRSRVEEEENRIMRSRVEEEEENRIMRSRVEEEENRIMRSRVEEEEENRIMRSRVEEEENRIMRSRVEEEEENRIMRSRVEEEENRIMRSRVEEEEENRIMRSRVEEEEDNAQEVFLQRDQAVLHLPPLPSRSHNDHQTLQERLMGAVPDVGVAMKALRNLPELRPVSSYIELANQHAQLRITTATTTNTQHT